jgi:hypothetical protein
MNDRNTAETAGTPRLAEPFALTGWEKQTRPGHADAGRESQVKPRWKAPDMGMASLTARDWRSLLSCDR